MWKAPHRPKNEVSQSFNSGIVTVYSVEDSAEPGFKPVKKLTEKAKLRYEERRLGFQRFYSGMQNMIQIERVIRVPKFDITNQDIAITEDGKEYRIDLVQKVPDVFPECVDISLSKIEQKFTEGEKPCGMV